MKRFWPLLGLWLLLSLGVRADDSFVPTKFSRDIRYRNPQFLWLTWDDAFRKEANYFSYANVGDLERILETQWASARKKNEVDLMVKAAIPLSMVYHNQAKFTQGLPFLEFLFRNKKHVPDYYWRHILIKLEEEYRGKNDIEKAIPIRQLRIESGYVKTFWEIYRECGLFEDALRDFRQFQPVPPPGDYARLFYLLRLGWLYTDVKNYPKAYETYAQGFREVAAVRAAAKKGMFLPRELTYWEGLFTGQMANIQMLQGDYDQVIPKLAFDIRLSGDNPDNQIAKLILLAKAHLHFKQWNAAKVQLDRARSLMGQKVVPPSKMMMLESYADYFQSQKRFDSAYYYSKAFQAAQDTANTHINRNKSILLLGQLELAKHREDALKTKTQVEAYSEEAELQDFRIKILSILLGTILFGSVLLFINFRQKGLLTQNQIQLDLEYERNAILLKELHHRVKNNLQVIYSLLNLQKRRSKNKESIDLILSLQNRIQTIALVHNNLFQSDEMEFVQLDPYLRTLVKHLQQMYVMDEKQEIEIQFGMDPNIYLRFERIGTLGLIINEIVSNAFKYAFEEGRAGVLRIDVQQVESEVAIEIEDNGPGVVEEIQRNSNLGMRLIVILSEQMGAQYVMQQSSGIKHLINFHV